MSCSFRHLRGKAEDVYKRQVADRVIFLDNGNIVEDATPDEFFNHPKTSRAKQFLNMFAFDDVKPHEKV